MFKKNCTIGTCRLPEGLEKGMLSAYDYFTNSFTISILQDFRESCTLIFTLASLENVPTSFLNEWYKTVRSLHTGCLDKGKDTCYLGYGVLLLLIQNCQCLLGPDLQIPR